MRTLMLKALGAEYNIVHDSDIPIMPAIGDYRLGAEIITGTPHYVTNSQVATVMPIKSYFTCWTYIKNQVATVVVY